MRTIIILTGLMFAATNAAQAKDMKSCKADWKTAKAGHTTAKHNDFMTACLRGPAAPAAPVAAPPVKHSFFSHPTTVSRPAPLAHSAPLAPAVAPAAAVGGHTAQCKDGSFSDAAHHTGACSHHGGVAKFFR